MSPPRPRRPAPHRIGAPVQLDLFGEVAARLATQQADADRQRRAAELLAAFQAVKHRHPGTGADLGPRMWCGRCGAVEGSEFLIVINHELDWCAGCYPRFRPGVPIRPFAQLSMAQRADRWDRPFFADCVACGHPWGLHGSDIGGGAHDSHAGCQALPHARCRCTTYLAPVAVLPQR